MPDIPINRIICGDVLEAREYESVGDMKGEEMRKKQLNFRCRHFNGIQHDECKAGVNYNQFKEDTGIGFMNPDWPCRQKDNAECVRFDPYTVEELEAERREIDARIAAFMKNVSPCCGAPLNTDHVITEGEFKNHGPRYCSKCGLLAYMV